MLESGEGTSFQTLDKKKKKIDSDNSDEAVARRMIYNFYITEKHVPTLES
jgi:hypothetical protein